MLCCRCGRRLVRGFPPPGRALAGTAAASTWRHGWTASIQAPHRSFSSDASDTKAGSSDGSGLSDQQSRPSSIFDELFPTGTRNKLAGTGKDIGLPDERDARLRDHEAEDDGSLGALESATATPDAFHTPHPTSSSPTDDPSAVPEEIRHWLDDAQNNERGHPEGLTAALATTTKQPPTILVLSGTTASLLPSDFFRIAPRAHGSQGHRRRGNSIDGWAAARGGLYKVMQDRDPATLAPRGRYFLYFGSAAGALAYAQEARNLHALARRALGLDSVSVGVGGGGGGGMGARRGTADDAAAAALRAFTLVAPSARLDLAMEAPAAEGTPGHSSLPFGPDDDAPAASTKVLLVLTGHGPDSSPTPGDGTTVDGVRRLLAADGMARNMPWGVSEGLNGVVPVPWVVAERRRRQEQRRRGDDNDTGGSGGGSGSDSDSRLPDLVAKTDQMNEHARYARFVVAFADAVEARRFVRAWHRRSVTLAWQRRERQQHEATAPTTGPAAETGAGLSAVLEATVLW